MKYRNNMVVGEWVNECNTEVSSGMYAFRDEVEYCQRKYDKALDAALRFSDAVACTPTDFCDVIRGAIGEDKRIVLPTDYTDHWPELWILVQELQAVKLEDYPKWDEDLEYAGADAPWAEQTQYKRRAARVDAYNEAVAEIHQLNSVLKAAADHC